MNKSSSFLFVAFTSLFAAATLHTLVMECLVASISAVSVTGLIFPELIAAVLFQLGIVKMNTPRKQKGFIVILSVLFSALLFGISLAPWLIGIVVMLGYFWLILFIQQADSMDIFKIAAAGIAFGLLSTLFLGTSSLRINQSLFAFFIQSLLMMGFLNLFYPVANPQDKKNQRLFAGTLILLFLSVSFFRAAIYQILSSFVNAILSVISWIMVNLLTLFTGVFILLVKAIQALIALLPFFEGTEVTQNAPLLPQGTMDSELVFNETVDPNYLIVLLQLIGIFLIAAFSLFLIRLIYQRLSIQEGNSSRSTLETREFIKPVKKKLGLRGFFKKPKTETLSSARMHYRKTVEALIPLHPYKTGMTPLEYLASLPQEVIEEKRFDTCTSEYIIARYRNNE